MSHPVSSTCETCGALISGTAAEGLCGTCLFQSFGLDAPGPAHAVEPGGVIRFFGDYELLEEVARGGMGVVYRARQVSLNRIVAVKLLANSGENTPGFAERFKIEAEAAASLDHPRIIPVYEFGQYGGQPFLAMRFVPGGRSLSGTRMSPHAAVEIMVQTAHAMQYAHQRGVLHRDLKPANILIDESGGPLVSDFGLAKLLESDSGLTRSVEMLGTPAYMPPEQASGNLSNVTTAADIYGLGAILYELLTGQPPFQGRTGLEIMRKVVDEDPRRLSSIVREVDRDLETICLKCLEKHPAGRYSSAQALAEDLERWLRHEPIRARPAGSAERLWKWARRHPAIAAVSAISLAAVVVIAIGSTLFSLRLQKSAEENRRQIIGLHQLSAEQMVDGGEAFTGLLHLTEAIRLEERDAPGSAVALRRLYQSILNQSPALEQLWFHNGKVKDAVFSPDGTQVLAGCDDGTAYVYDLATGALRHRLEHGWRIERVHWNATGTRLLLWSDKAWASLWDAATGTKIGATFWAYPCVSFHPDGSRLLVGTPLNLEERDATDGRLLRVLHDHHVTDAAYFPDGRRLVLAEVGDDKLHVLTLMDAQSGAVQESSCRESRFLDSLRISADGRTILARAAQRWGYVWKVSEFYEPPRRWNSGSEHIASMEFAPDSRRFASGTQAGRVALVAVEPLEEERELALGRPAARVAWRGDGSQMATASAGGLVQLWDLPSQKLSGPGLWHGQTVSLTRFSPDGKSLLTASLDGTQRLFRLPQHGGAGTVLAHSGTDEQPSWLRAIACGMAAGEWFTLTGDHTLRRWRGNEVIDSRTVPGAEVAAGFAAGQNRLILTDSTSVTVLEISSGKEHRAVNTGSEMQQIRSADLCLALNRVVVCGEPPAARRSPLTEFLRSKSNTLTRLLNTSTVEEVAAVYDLNTGALAAPPLKHPDRVRSVEFSPDGTRIVTACNDGIARIFDAATGQVIQELKHEFPLNRARFSPDGRTVLTACGGWKQLPRPLTAWQADTATPRWMAWHEDDVEEVSFSPDGRRIATIGRNAQVRLFLSAGGTPVGTPLTLRTRPASVQFSPDSSLLAIAGTGAEPNLLDTATALPVAMSMQHPNGIQSMAFSADSRTLATASHGGLLRLWSLDPAPGSVAELQRTAELLSNQTIDHNNLRRLSAEEMRARSAAR